MTKKLKVTPKTKQLMGIKESPWFQQPQDDVKQWFNSLEKQYVQSTAPIGLSVMTWKGFVDQINENSTLFQDRGMQTLRKDLLKAIEALEARYDELTEYVNRKY
jgi:hypothetical protein